MRVQLRKEKALKAVAASLEQKKIKKEQKELKAGLELSKKDLYVSHMNRF